jgi:hypothetical protein
MAEILGLGVTHFPPLAGRDDDMARILQRALKDAGAMAELGRKPTETAWVETYLFNSNKCFAYFLP